MISATMPCIGRGAFSTVYRKSRNKVLIKSRDKVKECMGLGWFPATPMFPKITHVATSARGHWRFYEERYYQKVKSLKKNLDPFEWEFYKALRDLNDSSVYWCDPIKLFNALPVKFNRRKEHLIAACNVLYNFGPNVRFEISPRNVAVHNRKLILLDCFFFN